MAMIRFVNNYIITKLVALFLIVLILSNGLSVFSQAKGGSAVKPKSAQITTETLLVSELH